MVVVAVVAARDLLKCCSFDYPAADDDVEVFVFCCFEVPVTDWT